MMLRILRDTLIEMVVDKSHLRIKPVDDTVIFNELDLYLLLFFRYYIKFLLLLSTDDIFHGSHIDFKLFHVIFQFFDISLLNP